jgi:hypothetical protein
MADPDHIDFTQENPRKRLARLAAEASAHQAAIVEAADAHLASVEQTAAADLARIVAQVRELPPQNQATLDPLWPSDY